LTFPLSTLIPLLAFAPLLVVFFLNLWAREPYQFFPLSIAAACYLAYRELKQRSEVGGQRSEVGGPTSGSSTDSPAHRPTEAPALLTSDLRPLTSVLCLAPSLLLLGVATVFWSPWLAAIAAFLGLIGLTLRRGGWGLFVAMIPALLMLAIIIPPPFNLDSRLTLALRSLAVRWSSPMLDLLGVTHVITGNLIEIPGRQLLVAEACSGINSVLSTLAACLFYLLLRRRSVLESIFALACTGIFVLLGNVARFTLGAWLLFRWRIDILSGWWHAGFGLVLFISYIVLILSFDQLWLFLTEVRGQGKGTRVQRAAVF
jgi:exosortase